MGDSEGTTVWFHFSRGEKDSELAHMIIVL